VATHDVGEAHALLDAGAHIGTGYGGWSRSRCCAARDAKRFIDRHRRADAGAAS